MPVPSSSASEHILLCNICSAKFSATDRPNLPDVQTKLRTNYIPTSSETSEIAELVINTDHALARYDEEISRLKLVLGQLERERKLQQKYTDSLKGLAAPIRRLPAELLGEIFDLCIRGTWNWVNEREYLTAMRLGLVCRRWRDIALSSKHLWTYIGVNMDIDTFDNGGVKDEKGITRITDIMQTYIERSGSLPLSIAVLGHESECFWRDNPVLSILASHSRRWYRAELRLLRPYFLSDGVLGPIKGNLPMLENLVVDIEDYGGYPTISLFDVCPKLSNFVLEGGSGPPLPWNQLSDVVAQSSTVAQSLMFLRKSENLVRFTIYERMEDDRHQATFASSNIQSLCIDLPHGTNHYTQFLALFFAALTVPCLRTLHIDSKNSLFVWPQTVFMSVLHRSSFPLDTLILDGTPISDTDLVAILKLVPTLRTLKIQEPNRDSPHLILTDFLLQSLTHIHRPTPDHNASPSLVPRLTHIAFTIPIPTRYLDSPVLAFTGSLLVDLVESRWFPMSLNSSGSGNVVCLERFGLVFERREPSTGLMSTELPLDSHSLARLRSLRSDGLKLVLR